MAGTAHGSRQAFENDRLRLEEMKLAGIDCIRISARRIETHPQASCATDRHISRTPTSERNQPNAFVPAYRGQMRCALAESGGELAAIVAAPWVGWVELAEDADDRAPQFLAGAVLGAAPARPAVGPARRRARRGRGRRRPRRRRRPRQGGRGRRSRRRRSPPRALRPLPAPPLRRRARGAPWPGRRRIGAARLQFGRFPQRELVARRQQLVGPRGQPASRRRPRLWPAAGRRRTRRRRRRRERP